MGFNHVFETVFLPAPSNIITGVVTHLTNTTQNRTPKQVLKSITAVKGSYLQATVVLQFDDREGYDINGGKISGLAYADVIYTQLKISAKVIQMDLDWIG